MFFEITRDEDGKPTHVFTDDGYLGIHRKFEPENDGWMENQLSYDKFPAVQIGRDTEYLIDEVNRLRREVFGLKRLLR